MTLALSGIAASVEVDYGERGVHHTHTAAPQDLVNVAAAFRLADYHLEHLTCLDLRQVEEVGAFRLDYQFNRGTGATDRHVVQALLAEGQAAPSIVSVYPGADWYEREVWDMHGVVIDGHPNLQRILMPDDYDGHPLRKDFVDADPLRHQMSGVVIEPKADEPAPAGDEE